MPYTVKPAVAFTECVWASLLEHADTYSPYGIGFTKDYLFQNGGGPVFYMRRDLTWPSTGIGDMPSITPRSANGVCPMT